MAKCPSCHEEIDELDAYSLEENHQTVHWSTRWGGLDWSTSDPVESSCVEIWVHCPLCDEVVFYLDARQCYNYEVIERFLKDGVYDA